MKDTNQVVIAAFYHFANLDNFEDMQPVLKDFCNEREMKGTILLAHEGINSTISGSRQAIDELMDFLRSDERLKGLEWKESYAEFQPFQRMKVRLKQEIVRLAVDDIDVAKYVGEYVDPKDWDALISDPDTVLIDTRNDYEIKIGTFENAIDPDTETFRDFPAWLENWKKEQGEEITKKKVAMFCTGGIRCEKSTALLRQRGFDKVYHLKGGILQYFEDTGNANGKWQGDCFVFDDRVAVNDKLEPSNAVICIACNEPVTTDDLRDTHKGQVICVSCMEKGATYQDPQVKEASMN